MLRRLRNRLRDHGPAQGVEPDPNLTNSRVTGGVGSDIGDAGPTTGTGPTGEYVGRIAGRDEGFAGETGAEVRAEGGPDESSRGERSG
ncbi:hypothetical protein AD006_30525 (plasmid) [Pseudonocardia sp. EC080610-09]|nr:hypothetical protein AD006_30525 [Pseudonocardia sp. EC080610-09]ALL85500.1 hypothetical protein AD017_30725 [Pseudonocardia sp. EC080619-01]